MKKVLWLVLILILACIITFSACDEKQSNKNNDDFDEEFVPIQSQQNESNGSPQEQCNHIEVIDKAIPATCTTDGKTEGKHCSVCGTVTVAQTTIKARGHAEVIDKAITATCTQSGKTEGKHCSVCGTVTVAQTTIKAKGHAEIIDKAIAATCTQSGKTEGKHCSVCGTVIIKQNSIGKTSHNYENGACTTCKGIDLEAKQTEIDAENKRHEDKLAEIEKYYPSLRAGLQERINNLKELNGITYVYDNSYCNTKISSLSSEINTLERKIASLSGSTNSSDVAERRRYEAQLTQKQNERNMYYACMTINNLNVEITNTYEYHEEAIINENALHTKKLEAIEKQYACASSGHKVVVDKAISPSCSSYGYTEGSHCSKCGATLIAQEVIEKLPHTPVKDDAVSPTCTATGLSEGEHCSRCSKVLVAQEIIEANDHNFKNRVCSVCGAIDYSIGLKYDKELDRTCTISGIGTCTDTEIYIPEYIDGYKVTGIGEKAFYKCTAITNITIPSSVTIIEAEAFCGCIGLASMAMPNSVTSIGNRAFYGCTGLESIAISNGVMSIDSYTFYGCSGLTSITIPSSVTSIGFDAFYGCSGLISITIPESVTSIRSAAFRDCTRLTSVTILGSVTTIEHFTFRGCTGLTSVTIPNNVTSIEGEAFYGCEELTHIYFNGTISRWDGIYKEYYWDAVTGNYTIYCTDRTIAKDVTMLPHIWYNYTTGDNITIAITNMGSYTGTELYIPEYHHGYKVTGIGGEAFRGCTNLTSITIPGSVTVIGDQAFSGCTSLTNIYYEGTIEQWNSISKYTYWNYRTGNYTIYCTDGNITK